MKSYTLHYLNEIVYNNFCQKEKEYEKLEGCWAEIASSISREIKETVKDKKNVTMRGGQRHFTYTGERVCKETRHPTGPNFIFVLECFKLALVA